MELVRQHFDQYEEDHSWINYKDVPFIDRNFDVKTIYFLYGFLGDSFEIKSESFIKNLNEWKTKNPDWEIKIIREDYDRVNEYLKKEYPNWFPTYMQYPKNIQRCDIFRYMLMFKNGGVYTDLDVYPKKSINDIVNNMIIEKYNLSWAKVIFGIGRIKEKQKCLKAQKYESVRHGKMEIPVKVSNFFFISRVKRHPIWMDILRLAKKRSRNNITSQYGIIYTTGPDLVTEAVSKNRHKYNDIAIIPLDYMKMLMDHQCSSSWRDTTFRKCETNVDTT